MAGALGAAAALATIEVLALLDASGTSVTEAVGNRFIDSFAASLKDVAVALFGTNDKAALQLGTALVAIAIGAGLGTLVERRPNAVVAGFAGFAVLGIAAGVTDPLTSDVVVVVSAVAGAAVGVMVTFLLAGRWQQVAAHEPALARRAVLVNGTITAGALVFATAVARSARDSARASVEVVRSVLPAPVRRVEAAPELITPTADFYRIDTALRVPVVDAASWKLRISGMVDRELTFTYDQLLARDLVEIPITMQCVSNEVGGDLIGTARWLGVPLIELLDEAGVQDGAEQIMGVSVDGFTAGFPVEAGTDGRDALVVVGMNGHPLPREHGYPVRLVIPGLYGYVSATKWLSEIRLTTWDEEGYWIPRGWSRLGPIKTQSRIDKPRPGSPLEAGTQTIAGVAWAPHRGIGRVEVRVDEGPWQRAKLGEVPSPDTWVTWWLAWKATAGDHTIEVRATDADGDVQTATVSRPDPDGATGHHQVRVSVR